MTKLASCTTSLHRSRLSCWPSPVRANLLILPAGGRFLVITSSCSLPRHTLTSTAVALTRCFIHEYNEHPACSPIFRGFLADRDCRWDVISGSVDCRTPQELGEEPLTTEKRVIHKSRYDSISSYISAGECACHFCFITSLLDSHFCLRSKPYCYFVFWKCEIETFLDLVVFCPNDVDACSS